MTPYMGEGRNPYTMARIASTCKKQMQHARDFKLYTKYIRLIVISEIVSETVSQWKTNVPDVDAVNFANCTSWLSV